MRQTKMMRLRRRFFWLAILLGCAVCNVQAIWVESPAVPLERVLKNAQAYLSKHPNSAQANYVLGRLHSLAFATGTNQVQVYQEPKDPLPRFPGYETILTPRTAKPVTKEARAHLLASIRHYQKATTLDPKQAMAWLGLGWVLEDGASLAEQVEPFPADKKPLGKIAFWQAKALAAYRQAYQLTVAQDLKLEGLGPGADDAISLEAGKGIIRLLGKRKLTEAERKEIAQIEKTNATIEQKPRAITPIIFPLNQSAALSALLRTGPPVRFDLAGDGQPSWWPWVKPEVGILVWNPSGNGRITSGLQLFGSVTWWIVWRNGYEPLALLDDDGDGWLRGRELLGIAVWRDANSNGISEAGEVVSLSSLRVERIAVQPLGVSENAPYHPQGIQLQDGRTLPSYDWTPTEVRPRQREYCY